jgi:hypothetical protein
VTLEEDVGVDGDASGATVGAGDDVEVDGEIEETGE